MVSISKVCLEAYALPFPTPFASAAARVPVRRGWWLRLTDAEGRRGTGDAAPWPGFGAGRGRVAAGLQRALGMLRKRRFADLAALDAWLEEAALPGPAAYACELAVLDLLARERGTSVAGLLASEPRAAVPGHALVQGADSARAAVARGARWLKLKALPGPEATVRRLAAVRAAVGPEVRLRLDCNGAWSLDGARRVQGALADLRLDWWEQPVARLAELAALRGPVPIAADESLLSESPEAVCEAVDGVVLKPMFLGGLLAARRWYVRARSRGLRVLLTHALESPVGRAGTLALAASLDELEPGGLAGGPGAAPELLVEGRVAVPGAIPRGELPARPAAEPVLPPVSVPASPDPFAVPLPLRSVAAARPELEFLRVAGSSVRAAALADHSARLAADLAAAGVGPGHCVALFGPAGLPWLRAFFALGAAGASVAPLPEDPGAWAQALTALRPDALWAVDGLPEELRRLFPGPILTPRLAAHPLPERFWPLAEERLRLLSSGSAGAPQARRLLTGQLVFSAFASATRLGLLPDDRWLACLPLFHVGGLSIPLRCAFYGIACELLPGFSAEAVAGRLDSGEISLVSLVPTMLTRVLDARPAEPFPPRLRAVLLGGAAAPPALLERCARLGVPVAPTWGMTEAASQVATAFPGQDGLPVLPSARVTSLGGGLLSSDLGAVEEGKVRVDGRADRSITSGGETFSLDAVEALFRSHPAVAAAAAVGLPDPVWGERLALALVPRGPDRPDREELRAWARGRLPAWQLPRALRWTAALPRTALGKRATGRLRALFMNDSHTTEEVSR